MIVRQFLHWLRTAPSGTRAEATGALARAYLYSDLSDSDRIAAEGAMTMLLDDPSPLVRRALADVFAASEAAPPNIVHALASDQPDVAGPVLYRSPLLLDADLVEAVASGDVERQAAVAMRALLPCSVAAAIAEVGSAEACLLLLENSHAELVPFSLDRIIERHGHLAAIRDVLLQRLDLTASTRQALVQKLSRTLAEFVTAREWLEPERAERVTREACERATVVLAADSPGSEVRPLIRHLCESGQLNAGLILRSLLSGNVSFLEESLAELAQVPLSRVAGIVHDRKGASFRALYEKAGLPPSTFLVFREALEAMREDGFVMEPGGASRLKRRIIERALSRCESDAADEIEPLLTLLRRFAAEAARDEARLFCDELVATGRITVDPEWHAEAA
ncbi:DUF2336 domain-containing protein [Rhodoplanes sp. Z2-YC6860]|uniref:DUF2336 domain-containing protein n=1 Tax=Rhodoplanes sp. Z2-YC6860 TaxID=674703 RepID=UPI00078B1C6C|nr:DUF2336 domain-containing protein [Rhodoplanes sp. Z2-YC6860]AMN42700.1 hypothetical protein RHPLAN_42700 [Rhodoplanes sp. Z2-YC6860]